MNIDSRLKTCLRKTSNEQIESMTSIPCPIGQIAPTGMTNDTSSLIGGNDATIHGVSKITIQKERHPPVVIRDMKIGWILAENTQSIGTGTHTDFSHMLPPEI